MLTTPCCASLSILHALLAHTCAPLPLVVLPSVLCAPTICHLFDPLALGLCSFPLVRPCVVAVLQAQSGFPCIISQIPFSEHHLFL